MTNKNDYIIFTDSGCDMSAEQLKEWGVPYRCLSFRFDGNDTEYSNEDMPVREFYDRMRRGDIAKTSAVNPASFGSAFDKILSGGRDILYLRERYGTSDILISDMGPVIGAYAGPRILLLCFLGDHR